MDVYARLEEMDADTAEVRAADILFGLGFTAHMMNKRCKDFSGPFIQSSFVIYVPHPLVCVTLLS